MGAFLADSSHFLSFDTWTLPLGAPNGVQLLEAPDGLQIQFQIVIYSKSNSLLMALQLWS